MISNILQQQNKKKHECVSMLSYLQTLLKVAKKKKVKRMKDPNAPKRALSGFFWFSNEERPKVQAANPDFKVKRNIPTY